MMTAALMLPPMRSGVTEASTTRSASTPRTIEVGIDDRSRVGRPRHSAGAERVMHSDRGRPDMRVDGGLGPAIRGLGELRSTISMAAAASISTTRTAT
jgi:hypothetical protein